MQILVDSATVLSVSETLAAWEWWWEQRVCARVQTIKRSASLPVPIRLAAPRDQKQTRMSSKNPEKSEIQGPQRATLPPHARGNAMGGQPRFRSDAFARGTTTSIPRIHDLDVVGAAADVE